MEALAIKLSSRDIPFDPVGRHVMCFAHIINLCSGRVIKKFDAKTDIEAWGDDEDAVADCPGLSNPITHAHSVVGAIWASGARRDAFHGVIVDGNAYHWFKEEGKPMEVADRQLLRYVPTRWDSVYYMVQGLCSLRLVSLDVLLKLMRTKQLIDQAINHFLALSNNDNLIDYRISPSIWNTLEDIKVVLSVGHD